MNRETSTYLDIARFAAALLVFMSHYSGFTGGALWQLGGLGHEAVVVFFVLSGFVIAYVTSTRETEPRVYAINRISRIYSVAIPAVALTVACDTLGRVVNPGPYVFLEERLADPIQTVLAALSFLNQAWSAVPIFSNLPYWSLAYEVWYYVLFGILSFTTGARRVLIVAVVLAIMGPSIILYLPIWWLGVAAYRLAVRRPLHQRMARLVYFCSMAAITVLCFRSVQIAINDTVHRLVGPAFLSWLHEPAEQFAADYMLGLGCAVNIYAFTCCAETWSGLIRRLERMAKLCSSYTFSLYLYHMPLLFLLGAMLPSAEHPLANPLCGLLMVPAVIVLLGNVTESKKHVLKRMLGQSRLLHGPKRWEKA